MNSVIQSELSDIRKSFRSDKIWIECRQEWSSRSDNFRANIRESLQLAISQKLDLDVPKLSDLSLPIQDIQPSCFSISHCRSLGGFAFCDPQHRIGFDLESSDRDASAAAKRMSKPSELIEAPDPLTLWVAKEAFFKALAPKVQPVSLSEVRISQWMPLKRHIYMFRGSCKNMNFAGSKGLVVAFKRFKTGLYLIEA